MPSFLPFFIRNSGGHGDYWLIHMSQHHKACGVMTEIYWKYRNNFIHYGGSGLDMFNLVGYDPNSDDHGQSALGFEFDDTAKKLSIQQLTNEFPRIISAHDQGISFETLIATTCNKSPATAGIYREALETLLVERAIQIVGIYGSIRRNGKNIKQSDRIIRPLQRNLFIA